MQLQVGCQAILQTKPCTSLNLARLITAKVPHEVFLSISGYQASSKPRICFVFYNNPPQRKAVTVNNKRKIFSFLTCLSWCRHSSAPTCTLGRADVSIASVSHLRCSLSSGLHCKLFHYFVSHINGLWSLNTDWIFDWIARLCTRLHTRITCVTHYCFNVSLPANKSFLAPYHSQTNCI